MQPATTFGAAPLLERLPIFHSRNAEETRAFLRAKEYRFDIARRQAKQLDARLNGIYMPSLYMGYVQYGGASVQLAPSPGRTDYWFHLPLRGQLEAVVGHDRVLCDPNHAVIVSPTRERCALTSEADSTRIQLSLNANALATHLAAMLGERPAQPLDFAPALDLEKGSGRSLARYVFTAVADLEGGDSMLRSPVTTSAFEQFIMTALLLAHPHNYSEALRRLNAPIAPRDVRRAVDFMEANLDAAITVADLVKATGVAGRTLFMHFRKYKGVSPIGYVRNARLEQVQQMLLRAEPGASVTEIAVRAGFIHMGRFSAAYRRRFGEKPSETLRRRQWRPPR